ncbi:HPP family protein [Desulfolucanica intricata]|uniref:HPP family protein n=1 Tax=Desulfolucanica intricata TaxID=1285191 RepID=UPI0008294EF2|nr:HPP family protein [Desulfolucanica intricata]
MPDYLPQKRDQDLTFAPLRHYISKMKGGRCTDLPKVTWTGLLFTAAGTITGVGLVAFLAVYCSLPLLLPSFGASAVLLYATCHAPVAQPRNVVGGHLVSAAAGVLVYHFFGNTWWTIALGVTLAAVLMLVTRTLHPPGGATAYIAVYSGQEFSFIIFPVGVGIICLVIIAVLINNLSRERSYPVYWF